MKPITTLELAEAYRAGASLNDLARQYPICRSAILYRLRRAGVTMRINGAPLGNQNARGRSGASPREP